MKEMMLSKEELARYIDHTLLKHDAPVYVYDEFLETALHYRFKAVCLSPYAVPYAVERLKGSGIAVCTVIGFPLGTNVPEVKSFEAAVAVEQGAQEIDMVINIAALKSGDYQTVRREIKAVTSAAVGEGRVVKVILETCLLTDEEKRIACELALEEKADFVKTSTGFSTGGATVEDVRLLSRIAGGQMGVKASGGIKTLADALAMIKAGATRIGTSSGHKILAELN